MLSTRGLVCITAVLALCLSVTPCSAAFRGSKGGSAHHSHIVATSEVESSLRSSLEMFAGGGRMAAHKLAVIEASTWQTFQALPKNEHGRLGPKAVRYVVHSYFAKQHGWLIQGLEPHGMRTNVTEVHEVSILQDKAPALVEALLENRQSDHGLPLNDIVTMIAALERLVFDESMELLQAAYKLNDQLTADSIGEEALHEVLRSYLLVFGAGDDSIDLSDMEKHRNLKAALKSTGTYADLTEYEQDTVGNFGYEHRDQTNPFAQKRYSFETASQIAEAMTHGYGKWQNAECLSMKAVLMDLDPKGTGRVPLGSFYSQPEESTYQFSESVDYLRQTGALDETGSSPAVLIPNYLAGPTNCIASSAYYSICCMNECEAVMNELEHKIQAPTASPERLLGLVSNISSSTVDAPRALSPALKEKLHTIADPNDGEVPLHGRLFAQWIHFAFPNECPFPQVTESAAVLTPSQWMDEKATASSEEKQLHIEITDATTKDEEVDFMSKWSDDEVLPVFESQKPKRSALAGLVRVVVQVAGLVVVLRSAMAAWGGAAHAYRGGSSTKDKKTQLPW